MCACLLEESCVSNMPVVSNARVPNDKEAATRRLFCGPVAQGLRCRVSYSKGCGTRTRRVIIEVSVEWVRLLEALRFAWHPRPPMAHRHHTHLYTCTRTQQRHLHNCRRTTVVPLAAWRLINYHLVIIGHAVFLRRICFFADISLATMAHVD